MHKDWVKRNPEKVGEYRQRDCWTLVKRCQRRGITPQILIETFEKQNGHCPICEIKLEIVDSAIDHNHATGVFRGVLCKKCNRALGMFHDSKNILSKAINYLDTKGSYATK